MSNEHVWPVWSHELIRKPDPSKTHVRRKYVTSPRNPDISGQTDYSENNGDVTSIKLKVVCEKHCNNGWMSRLETKAKPFLTPLLTGGRTLLNKYDQEVVATWAAMKMLTAEFSIPEDTATPAVERSLLMGRRLPPQIMRIWVAHYDGASFPNTYFREAVTLEWAERGKPPSWPPDGSLPKNTHCQSFTIGKLFVQTFTSTVSRFEFEPPRRLETTLRKIWPFEREFMWPPERALPDSDMVGVVRALRILGNRLPFVPGPTK